MSSLAACRPQAFSLLTLPSGTDLEVVDMASGRVEQRVTLTAAQRDANGPLSQPAAAFKYIHHDLERNE